MSIAVNIESVAPICKRFDTGEQPVLLDCSDGRSYVCKYGKSTGAKYKLLCEFVGYMLAETWNLNVPEHSLVKINVEHIYSSAPIDSKPTIGFGSLFNSDVIDVTELSIISADLTQRHLECLLLIALFDVWTANEDRGANNYNLLFDVQTQQFVPIDFGCIFNTATFDFPLSQLTYSETLLYSELFSNLTNNISNGITIQTIATLRNHYVNNVEKVRKMKDKMLHAIPLDWNIPSEKLACKLDEICSVEWVQGAWDNFMETLKYLKQYE